jgi:type II restriction enzyme
MSKKHDLRVQRTGTVINRKSSEQERVLDRALNQVCDRLEGKFPGIHLHHERQWLLPDVIASLHAVFPGVEFFCHHATSAMRPDGGILSLVAQDAVRHPILITEKKNQGTNDLRVAEGKGKQAKGNAIERLGKNVIGFRAAMLNEAIFPFVCFGDGCDFAAESSILDRVVTIAMFGRLNMEHLHNQGPRGVFNRGSFYFRVAEWTESEMIDLCYPVAEKSIYYYFSKYGEAPFLSAARPST